MADKIDALFEDLQSRGFAKDKTRKDFRSYMLAPGEQGYQNRKDFFEDFKSQGLTDLGTYEDFAQLIGLRGVRRSQPQQPQQQPVSNPNLEFAPLDTRQANKTMIGRGPVSWEDQNSKTINPADNAIQRVASGNLTPEEQKRVQKRMGQRMDEIEYEQETGNRMRQPVVDIPFEAPTIARDEYGNIRRDENGTPLVGFTTDQDAVIEHQQIMADQAEWDALSDEEKHERAKQAKLRAEELDYTEPTLWDTIKKSVGSGIIRTGLGLLEAMDQLSSGMIVEDPSSPTGYIKTKSYEEQLKDKDDHVMAGMNAAHDYADILSRQAQPYKGKGFLDMLWDGEIGGVLQKGVATAGESLPMTLSAYNPYTMVLNGISLAGNNYRDQVLENPDVPEWKRLSMAIGSAAIEQIVEKYSDPVFKYVGGSKILKGAAKEASEEISKDITKKATETIAQRIFKGLGGLAKDAAGEGAEEVITNFGNDALGELLDLFNGDKDYGLRAQWQQLKKENPDADLWDFAQQKAKENVESFIGGAMAGAYTSGTAQLSLQSLQYALGNKVSAEQIASNPDARIDPATMEVAQAYDDGYSETDPNLLKQFNDEAQKAQQILPQYGKEFAKMVMESESPVETLDYLMQNRDLYTDEQIAAAADYYQNMSRINGAMDGALDRIDLEVEKQKARVREETHQATGDIIDAEGTDGQPYNIIGGDVVTDPDTGVTSLVGTGGAVVVRNTNTGEVSVKSPQELTISNVVPAETMIQYYDVDLRNQLMQQADDDMTFGSPANEVYQLEDTVTLNDGEGNTITGEIVGMPNSIDGVYQVKTNDTNKPMKYLTDDELNRMIVAHNGQEVQRGSQQPVVKDNLTTEQPGAENAEIEQNNAQNAPENIQSNTGGEASAENGTGANEPSVSALSRIPVLQDEKGQPILNKNGNPQYQWHKASVDDTAAAIIEMSDGDKLTARDTASDMVNNAKARLEKIRKEKPKTNIEDPSEIIKNRREIKRREEETQQIIKHWQDVNQAIQKQMNAESERLRQEAEAKKSEEQRKREAAEAEERKKKQDEIDRQRIREQIEKDKEKRNKEYAPLTKAKEEMKDDPDAMAILSDTEPRSLDEWVSSLLRPHSLLWQDASPSEVGLQSELGLKRSDMQRFMTLLGNKDSNATPFGKAVLDIYEALPEGMKEMYTDDDVRNTLLNLFNEGSSTRMMHLTEENRIDEARETMLENLRRDAEAEMEAWAEANHLTPEERETYEDFLAQEMMQGAETEFINQLIAEDEQNTASKAMDSNPASRSADREGEGGESQVQGQGAAETAGVNQEEQQPQQRAETPTGSTNVSDSDVSGGTQGRIAPSEQLKPTDLRDATRVESPELGVNEANAKARQAAGGPQPIGNGDFGPIYDQFRGKPKEAIDFLTKNKNGEALGALSHKDIGEIDLVWGEEGTGHSDGFGLAKLVKYHPEVLENLQEILDEMEVVKRTDNRINLESDKYKAAVRLTWNEQSKTWLLTIFEKKNSALDNTTDTGKTSNRGKRNDTATPQSTVSEGKDTKNSSNIQENQQESSQQPQNSVKRLVSDDRMEDLKKRLRNKLGGQLNVGVDPEILAIGAEIAVGYIERGVTKFADFAKAMIDEVGDFMRPYLKSFYNAVRDMPEAESYADQMEDYETVSKFDVYNFDKGGKVPDAMTKAEQIVNEQKVNKQAKKIKEQHPDLFAGDLFGSQEEAQPIGKTSSAAKIATEEDKVDTNPTEAQKEAGNYQKGHIKVDGYDITIENPKGSIRRGVDANGKAWEQKMNNTYGYIRGTEAVDGDHIDIFLSDNPTSGKVFVVDQVKPDGSFDEVKVMYGFKDIAQAAKAYLSNYEDGWKGLGNITSVSREAFKEWIESSHRKTKPFREYALAKRELAKENTIANIDDVFTDKLYVDSQGNEGAINKIVDIEEDGDTRWYVYQLYQNDEDFKNGKVFTYAKIREQDLQAALDTKEWKKQSEQLKPTDLRDGIKPDTAELGAAEAKAKAKHLQSVKNLLDKHLKKYRTLAPVEIIDVDSEETDQSLKDTKDPVAFDPETKKILIFANNIDEDYFEEGLFHESVHRGLQQYYGDGPIELAEAFWETQSPDKPEVTKRQKETISKEYAHKPEDIKEEYFVHLLSHHMKKGSVDKILSRLSPEHQEIVNNILHNIGYDTAEETKRRAREEAHTSGSPENSEKSEDGRGVASSTDKIEDVGEEIAGARKDLSRKIAQSLDSATKQTLGELPFSKAYKKPDLKKAIEEGALRESDAVFYDAFFSSFVDQNKPRVTKTEERRKKYNPAYRTDLEKWVDSTHQALQALKDFVEADEQQRDRIIESLLADRYPFREKELTELEKRKEWNKDRKDLQWGEKTTPNPLWVTYEVMKRLDYTPGDKLDIPFGILKADTTGTQYSLYNKKDEHNYYASPKTVEEGIDAIVWLARLKRGDSDIQHPVYSFYTVPTKSEMAENGKYRVIWGGFRNIQSRDFDSKEDAEAFASTKKTSTNIMPLKEVVRRFGYKVMFRNPLTGERYTVNDKEFETDAEARQYLEENYDEVNSDLNGVLSAQQKEKENTGKKELTPDDMIYTAMVRNKEGKYTYGVLIDKKYANNYGMPLIIKEGFATRNEAKDFAEKAKEEVFKAYQEYKAKQKAFVYFDTGADSRIGEDYRGGKDVTAEDFMNTFGFRGVQFGNWTNQADRQMAVNQAYDAFLDLAKLIGVSPKAISLNGELGIAFGARGSGNFAAHYEPGEIVINLTKTMGAGSLAHEWWHALDNYFARTAGERGGMVTDDRSLNMRQQLRNAFNTMLEQVAKSPYYSRSKDKGDYWGRMHEVTARLLAEWVDQELKKHGELNTFLSRGAKTEGTMKINYERYKTHAELAGKEVMPFEEYKKLDEAMSGSPYPSPQEVERFSDAMRNIFDVMQERIDDETGNVALYHKVTGTEATAPNSRETALRDQLIETMRNAGIEVITDDEDGQDILDENVSHHKVDDADELKQLESQPTVKRYRAMQLIDGKLYPPMSAKVDGQMRQPTEIGVWEKSEERPDLIKNGKFVLNKGQKGQGNVPAAYNPYFHTSTSGLNDQFTSAYKRPELVVVEVEIPESELTSGYKAEGAKDAVGNVDWHSGVVNGQLPTDRQRQVTLSRYNKVTRIVPDSEVADMIAKQLEGTSVEVPYNVVTPALRAELEKRGVKISDKPAGKVTEDINGRRIMQQKVEPVFYSNAMRAVEAIKQDKATPDQWLAMLQKNGGLKAGEDKWIGLSDYLEEAKKEGKNPTKQEVLDYIRQNQIQVEEQKYREYIDLDNNPKMQEYRREFNEILEELKKDQGNLQKEMEDFENEMYDKYGYGWANKLNEEEQEIYDAQVEKYGEYQDDINDAAFNEMVNRHGDDFSMAFEYDYGSGELVPTMDMYGDDISDAAKTLLEFDELPINSTRLDYTTDGLTNKKEIALTVPTIAEYGENDPIHFGDADNGRAVAWIRFGDTNVRDKTSDQEARKAHDARVAYDRKMGEKYNVDPTSIPSLLMAMTKEERAEERRLADAESEALEKASASRKRVLVIDEIQSKRHQDARTSGYNTEFDQSKLDQARQESSDYGTYLYDKYIKGKHEGDDFLDYANEEERKHFDELTDKVSSLERQKKNGVPDAPFEKNWHELAMKRMLRYAAENGYDKIAWTTGEQQAERYTYGGVVPYVDVTNNPDSSRFYKDLRFSASGHGCRVATNKDGIITLAEGVGNDANGRSLNELFGKDIANEIMEARNGARIQVEGRRVGGEGLKGFYDDILPRFMNKYGKKWGVKVEETQMPDGVYESRWSEQQPLTMHSIDVTPEMKESVMQGQPMFFRTKDGQAYGYTYNGKIYVDPSIATAETPVHEYTHLWAEALRQKDPDTWNQIVSVLKNDETVKPFWDKVARLYPELTDENDMAEEVLAQYSGQRGSEQLREVANEIQRETPGIFGKAQAVEALRRMKNILSKFWKAVADMMGWQFTNAQEIADKVLYDLLSGVNPKAEGSTKVMEQRAEDAETIDPEDAAMEMYNKSMQNEAKKWQEAWQDSMISLKSLQDAIAQQTGNEAKGAEDAYSFENRMHGRSKNMGEQFDWQYYQPMLKAFDDFCKAKDMTDEQAMDYLVAKHGLERNMYYAFRDAMKRKVAEEIKEEREKLEKAYALNRISEDTYKDGVADLRERELNGVDEAIAELQESEEYNRLKDDYQAGRISHSEFLKGNEELRREATRRKKPRMDQEGHIISDNYYDENATDYSGLTETFAKQPYDEAQKIKRKAQREIDPKTRKMLWQAYDVKMREAYALAKDEAENRIMNAEHEEIPKPASETASGRLWNAINAATKKTLQYSYESGMMDRKNYNKVRKMFDFYIPLRGWDENRASDVYSYVGRDNVFSPAVKKTWGRKSKADSPLAYIGNIAMSTIISGHHNQMKQHFLNYVLNNPTSLVSISESWYENIGTERNPMWILRSADTAGKSADEIAQIVNDFNEEMAQKQAEGKAIPVRGRLRLDVHATQGQKAEHVVEVQQAGRNYQMYINGDPRAAQALNGTLPKAVTRISNTAIGKELTKLNRNMAAFFTSKNPAFVVSNLSRDLNMAGASVAIKEGPAYNAQFIKNVAKVLAPRMGESSIWIPASKQPTGLMPSLMRKWKKGTLDTSNETERLFKEFMDEGGETGFVNMLSVDSFKEKMQKEIAQMHGSDLLGRGAKECSIKKGLRLMGETFEFYNRCAEDATRFIVYMTSRQMGKTLEESIADAKDVTLNFNRKGTGAKGNAEIRDLFIFVNPAIQALANMYKMSTGRTLKFARVTALFFAGGVIMPIINQWLLNMFGDDDDKEAYWNLPPWIRKNNLVYWIPFTKNFVTIPLAQEFRVFYGAGEMLTTALSKHQIDKPVFEILSSVADLVPINPMGNGGNLMIDLAPTGIQPLSQLAFNTDFTGKPIWRENQGNKHAPMYTKAYVTTPNMMIKFSEKLNDWTGGNEGKKGLLDEWGGNYINNPAVWNHLLQGYLGGMYNTIAKTADVVYTAASGEMPKVMQMPVINRFLNRPVERENAGVLGEDYYRLKEQRDALNYELRTFRKKAADGDEEAQKRVDEILSSDEWRQAEVFNHYEKIINDLRNGEQAATESADKGDIKKGITDFKQQMMEELNAIGDGSDPLEVAIKQMAKAKTFEERNKLRMRIERLTLRNQGVDKSKTKSRSEEVEKALRYITDAENESRDTDDNYLMLATPENVRDDARIKATKAKIKKHTDEFKRLIDSGAGEKAAEYRNSNLKWFRANDIINQQERAMRNNKKLLGKGRDANIMQLIDQNRKQMLKAIEGLE